MHTFLPELTYFSRVSLFPIVCTCFISYPPVSPHASCVFVSHHVHLFSCVHLSFFLVCTYFPSCASVSFHVHLYSPCVLASSRVQLFSAECMCFPSCVRAFSRVHLFPLVCICFPSCLLDSSSVYLFTFVCICFPSWVFVYSCVFVCPRVYLNLFLPCTSVSPLCSCGPAYAEGHHPRPTHRRIAHSLQTTLK